MFVPDQLSPEEVAELGADHLEDGPPDEDEFTPISFDGEPASTATALGRAILKNAEDYLKIPLREDAGVNQDTQGHIRRFFIEGIPWNTETWDDYAKKYPSSPVNKPEWCAAFACYCVRKGHESLHRSLPTKLNASTSSLVKIFDAAGQFLRREKLFDAEGSIHIDAAVLPRPGDLVTFHAHTALLKEIYADGSFVTIEGNTYRGSPRQDGVYQCNRSSREKKANGTFKLVGFCLLNTKDDDQTTSTPIENAAANDLAAEIPLPTSTAMSSGSEVELSRGDKGQDVRELQEQLNAWINGSADTGLAPITADGSFGKKTEAALVVYQRKQMKIDTPTGRADEATRRSLAEKAADGNTSLEAE